MSGDSAKAKAGVIVESLRALESPKDKEGMARYGIKTDKAFGISIYVLRKMAKDIGTDHDLALALWDTGIHEAQLLAGIVDDPAQVTERQMEQWVVRFRLVGCLRPDLLEPVRSDAIRLR